MKAPAQSTLVLDRPLTTQPIVHRPSCPYRSLKPGRAGRVYVSELPDAEAYGWRLCSKCRPADARRQRT